MCVNIMCNAIFGRSYFPGIGSKQMIKDHKNTSHVFINILRITAVVNAMIRRGVEHHVQYSKLAYILCVDKKIINGADRFKEKNHFRWEAE